MLKQRTVNDFEYAQFSHYTILVKTLFISKLSKINPNRNLKTQKNRVHWKKEYWAHSIRSWVQLTSIYFFTHSNKICYIITCSTRYDTSVSFIVFIYKKKKNFVFVDKESSLIKTETLPFPQSTTKKNKDSDNINSNISNNILWKSLIF